MSALRIALVTDWFLPRVGGMELHLRDLAHHLMADGHDVRVITPTPGAAVVEGIRVHRLDAPRATPFGLVYTPGAIRSIGEILEKERIDVAHCHVSIVSPAAFGGGYEAQRRGIPAVLTFHSIVPQTSMLMRGINLALRCSTWPVVTSAVSQVVARGVRPIAGPRPVEILQNGIDPAFWRAAPRASFGSTIEIVSVMRLNAKKRPLVLVQLMRALARSPVGARQVRLRIAGDGPMREKLSTAITRAGLGSSVELLGQLTRTELRGLLAKSDLFVLPSIRESFGIAALEARCAGLPVVTIARSGVSEFVRHEQEGLLAHSDRDLVAQVRRLVIDDDLRGRIAQHNLRTSPDADWGHCIVEHRRVYEKAIRAVAALQPLDFVGSRRREPSVADADRRSSSA